ncbi:MAG: methyltransferase domain-containing protein [Actinomycetota bacterium]|nr:methyltransferase domain-containing protein [Actinomycetota bacterium]
MSDEVHERLADLALHGPAVEVVDLGAGQGRTLVEVAHRAPASRLTAIDLDADALAALGARLPQARLLRHDLADPLPLPDDSLDVVVSHNTLECLLDPGALLTEMPGCSAPVGARYSGTPTSRRS